MKHNTAHFRAYHSYLEAIQPLDDAERGRLFAACLAYSKSGKMPELRGNERFVFYGIKADIDEDRKAAQKTGAAQRRDTAWEQEMLSELPEHTERKMQEWVDYHKAIRKPYKEAGLKALVRIAQENIKKYGEKAVCGIIDQSMANGYQGITWDRLGRGGAAAQTNKAHNHHNRSYTAEDLEKIGVDLLAD